MVFFTDILVNFTKFKLVIFSNFLLNFANHLAKFTNFLVKNGNKIDFISVNFHANKLAIIAKNIAQGKNIKQIFGNRKNCLIL